MINYNNIIISTLQSLSTNKTQNYSKQPIAIFLIGTNGSGKSSLRHYLDLSSITTNLDPDDLKLKQNGNHNLAARQTIEYFDLAIKYRSNICRESTLAGRTILQAIQKAKSNGYYIIGYFVGLSTVSLHIDRVAQRVAKGGHHITDELIKKRYHESLKNLTTVYQLFDVLHIIDNSGAYFIPQFSINQQQLINKKELQNLLLPRFTKFTLRRIITDKFQLLDKHINWIIHVILITISTALPISLLFVVIEIWKEIFIDHHYYCGDIHHITVECSHNEAIIENTFSLILFALIILIFWTIHGSYIKNRLSKKNIEKNLKSPIKDWAEQLLNNIIKTR